MSKYITIMLLPEGGASGKEYKLKSWLLKFMISSLVALLLGIILFFSFYGKILARAATAEQLEKENRKLIRYQYKVKLLEDNLIETREVVGRLIDLAGIDYKFPDFPTDSHIFANLDKRGMAVVARSVGDDFSIPSGLPLTGFISQEFEIEDKTDYHPGVDIACGEETPILTTASGIIEFSGFDETYGNMVVIKHNDTITSIYGHNKENLVKTGELVVAGARIALSGNTGKSTAPHLHYEVRINDVPVNPMDL